MCKHSGACLYTCGALTLAGSVSVTTAGCGRVGTRSLFWNSPGWGSSSGGDPCIAPAPCSWDDSSRDRSVEVEGLSDAACWFLGCQFVLIMSPVRGDSYETSPSEEGRLQIHPHGSGYDHHLVP